MEAVTEHGCLIKTISYKKLPMKLQSVDVDTKKYAKYFDITYFRGVYMRDCLPYASK